jgi:hypothetical protein
MAGAYQEEARACVGVIAGSSSHETPNFWGQTLREDWASSFIPISTRRSEKHIMGFIGNKSKVQLWWTPTKLPRFQPVLASSLLIY